MVVTKMAKKNSGLSASQKYWEKRRALEDQYRLIQENATLKKLTDDILPSALKEIQKQLAVQADLHDISLAELLEDYSKRDQKKYREQVEKNYKELMNSDEKYQEFIDEFFPDYDYAKINRLLQIRTDIFDILAREMISKDANKVFNDRLEDILKRTYSSNSNALARIINVNIPNRLSQSELDNILNYPWSGKTFSNRLWGNVSKLEQNLSSAIVRSVSSGQGVLDALKTMRENPEICDMFKKESSKYKKAIENLVRTEYASFAQQGIAKSYEATGVEEYDVLTSEDEKVCSICGGVEKGNPYKLKDAVIGVNRGPFHGRCRCTDIPHIPDLPVSIDKEYEAMFGELLDEFANDQFGVKLTHPKKAADQGRTIELGKNFTKESMRGANPQLFQDQLNNAPASVKNLWNKHKDNLKIVDIDKRGAYFAPSSKGVNLPDIKGQTKVQLRNNGKSLSKREYSTFFHEFGHMIDYLSSDGKAYSSSTLRLSNGKTLAQTVDDEGSNAIKNLQKRMKKLYTENGKKAGQYEIDDVKTYLFADQRNISKTDVIGVLTRKLEKFVMDEAKAVSDEFPGLTHNFADTGSITDLFGGVTRGKINNKGAIVSGHSKQYWSKGNREESLGAEAFAEFFSALQHGGRELNNIKQWFPESFEAFEELIKILGG